MDLTLEPIKQAWNHMAQVLREFNKAHPQAWFVATEKQNAASSLIQLLHSLYQRYPLVMVGLGPTAQQLYLFLLPGGEAWSKKTWCEGLCQVNPGISPYYLEEEVARHRVQCQAESPDRQQAIRTHIEKLLGPAHCS